jgi:hypothetical protein
MANSKKKASDTLRMMEDMVKSGKNPMNKLVTRKKVGAFRKKK